MSLILALLLQVTIREEASHVCRAMYVNFTGAAVTATCPNGVGTITVAPAFSHLSGTATDIQIPNDITIDLAAAASALAANGTNCSAGQYARGVDASGNAEGCTADVSGGGGGTPASTVEDETTLGITPAVGTDTEYARQDHTHGSPTEATLEAALELADLQGSLTIAGDVDGAHGSTDIDETAVETELEGVLDLDQLQGTISDTQIAAGAVDGGAGGEIADGSVTADDLGTDSVSADELNATGVESELEAVVELADLQGVVPLAKGGTTETASTEDAVLVGDGVTDWVPKVIPDCDGDATALHYDQTTNTFTCGDDDIGGGSPWVDSGTVVELVDTSDDVNLGDNVGIDTAPVSGAALKIDTGSASKYNIQLQGNAANALILGTNLASSGVGISLTADINYFLGSTYFGNSAFSPVNSVDVGNTFGIRVAGYTASNGSNNDIATGGYSSIKVSGPTAAFAITGVATSASGRILTIINSTVQPMTISHESASSVAANRITTHTGADVQADRAILQYDPTGTARWHLIAYTPAASAGGGAPTTATYITQTSDAGLSNEQALSALSTGILKVTTTTGVLSTAVAADFPTLNQSTTGTAALASALAANGTNCSAGNYPLGVDAAGNAESCTAAGGGGGGWTDDGSIVRLTTAGDLVGIGTPSALATLHLASDGTTPMYLDHYSNTTGGATFRNRKARGTLAAPLRTQGGDTLASINAMGAEAASDVAAATWSTTVPGSFRFVASESFTSSAQGTSLHIRTTPIGSVTPVDRLNILPSGTTWLDGGLHVGGSSDPGDNNVLIDGTLTVTGATTLTTPLGVASGGTGIANPTKRLAANSAISSTTKSNLTGFSWALSASTNYSITCYMHNTSNIATVGVQYGFTYSGVTTTAQFSVLHPASATAMNGTVISDTTFPIDLNTTVSQGNVAGLSIVSGTIEVSTAGTLQATHGSETASLTTTLRGSYCTLEP